MARKKDPVVAIVTWFQTEPLPQVVMLQKVLNGLVASRSAEPPATLPSLALPPQKPARRGRGPNKPKAPKMTGATPPPENPASYRVSGPGSTSGPLGTI